MYNFDIDQIEDSVLVGDFNLIRSPDNRNMPGANKNDLMLFNDLILHLDLAEIQFQGRQSDLQLRLLDQSHQLENSCKSWSFYFQIES